MLSGNDPIFISLQQAVLDCEDDKTLLEVLFKDAYSTLRSEGFGYVLIHALFTNSDLEVVKSSFYDGLDYVFSDKRKDDVFNFEKIFQNGPLKSKLESNQVVISQDVESLVSPSYKNNKIIKSIVISPINIRGQLGGVLILGRARELEDATDDEMGLIEQFTNLVAFTYRLQDTQISLSEITKQVYTMNAKLHQLDKLKDEFVSMASHELRTPMTAIKSYLWMAIFKRRDELSPDLRRYLERSYISVERLINLVNDMLNISRIDSGRIALDLEEVDMLRLVGDVVFELSPKAKEKGIDLSVSSATLPPVFCDSAKIHEVLMNLAGNSLKFTKAGGKITISFKAGEHLLEIIVKDTGPGIAKEDIGKLFSKFTMLANSYEGVPQSSGTGLGLYICKSIVNLHKGQIFASSDGIGKGATFTFTLPLAGSDIAQRLEESAPKMTSDKKDLEKTNVNV